MGRISRVFSLLLAFSGSLSVASDVGSQKPRILSFYDVKSNRNADFSYRDGSKYNIEEIKSASLFLRDDPNSAGGDTNPLLFDFLYEIKAALEKRSPGGSIVFHVISGYRSPKYNKALIENPKNPYRNSISKSSQHIKANALDFYVPGFHDEELRNIAWCLQRGGVGYYPEHVERSGYEYIHIDVGRVRFWGGNFNFYEIDCEQVFSGRSERKTAAP